MSRVSELAQELKETAEQRKADAGPRGRVTLRLSGESIYRLVHLAEAFGLTRTALAERICSAAVEDAHDALNQA